MTINVRCFCIQVFSRRRWWGWRFKY